MPQTAKQDTIMAPATPVGGAIAILRISGEDALRALQSLTQKSDFAPRLLQRVKLFCKAQIIDDAMAVYFCAPHSYTGEDMAELHMHGSGAIMHAAMESCMKLGLRMAQPGEFTRRAFVAGKMDLAQAEAVMLSIQAETEAAAAAARNQLHGALTRQLKPMQDNLVQMLAHIEATIDYPEEMEDDPFSLQPQLGHHIEVLVELQSTQKQARLLYEGYTVAIVGQPNVGKSALLNALVKDERAIVTEYAGTTRDVLEARLHIRGIPVRLFDTAGIREAENEIERIGVDRARRIMRQADLRIVVLDANRVLDEQDRMLLRATQESERMIVLSKSDLPMQADMLELKDQMGGRAYIISAVTGEGVDALLEAIASGLPQMQGTKAMLCNARQAEAVTRAVAALQDAAEADALDLAAIDIRDAWTYLGEITGETANERVIEEIFAAFCVGK